MPRESLGPKGNKPRIPLVEQNTTRWYAQYRSVVRTLPLGGTHATARWYARYHLVVRTLPFGGTHNTIRWYARYRSVIALPFGGKRII